ncbi:hypothetical protein V5799_013297 [Amblyomma americanum]|uniref:glycogenin glucosyltransferase n=1 Tax=Amblyomma americanum TaxID=6943 RepID=A0AAQ4E6B3_AMBAM
MSSAQREPLNTEFSESTEFDRCLPPYKEINQADLPASFVVEDDLHSLTDVTASRPHCDDLKGQGAASPKRSLSTVVCEPSEVVAQSLKGDEGIINPHYTESGDLQGSVKRPSELQLYNLGSSLQDKPADSAVSEGQHGGARRKQSLNSDWMTDLVQPLIPEPAVPSVRDQAYVTMANNDLSAMVCLVLGNSLWLSKTSRSLVVLVTDGVSHAFRHLLSCVFNVVLSVRSLGTQGTTKLALLEQPDIGVSFTKLHAWRLTQFSKCVFMDAGMLVVQNCDELFERDELSAVPDIGWPDCFNSGLFVYVPSMETFWDLISFAERQGSFDGGDQGLLNTYFRNWSSDINRRLPFIYNLMANVCYTYKPAFKQFGQNVKVVQFLGGYKPWNVKFHPPTGTLSPAADVHPTYVQFVQFWVQIFVKRVLPLFSSNIQAKTNEQRYTCALDILQHFPSFLVAEPMDHELPLNHHLQGHLFQVRQPHAQSLQLQKQHQRNMLNHLT